MAFTLLKDQQNNKSVVLPKQSSSFKLLSQQKQPVNIPNAGKIVNKTLPGGGVYQMKIGDPNYNANLEHTTYGGLPTKPGYERADIFPVSLSGVNEDKRNIVMEKNLPAFDKASLAKEKGQPYNENDLKYRTATDKYLMEEILPKYKSGEMSLREAQVKSVSYLRNEQEGLNKAMKNENLGGQFGVFADDFVATAQKIGSFLGKKVGIIAEKVLKKNQPSMTFKVGEGLNTEQQQTAQDVINYEVAKGAEERTKLPLPTKIKNTVVDQARKGMPDYQSYTNRQNAPIIAEKKKAVEANIAYEKTLTPMQLARKNDPLFISQAKMASEVLGREVKPENYDTESKNFTPEQRNLISAKLEENTAETVAKVVTAPVRFTIGQIARDYAMTEDELKGYNEKFIPTSDVEKLIYGEEPIEKISNSEDLYGLIGKNIGIPAAIAAMVALDLNLPGPKTLMKKYFEEKIAKEGIEKVAKMGADEYIKLIDEAIAGEVRLGKVTEEQVIEATVNAKKGIEEMNAKNKTKPALPKQPKTSPVEPQIAQIGTETAKAAETKPTVKKVESDKEFRYHETSINNIESIKKNGLKPSNGQYGKGVYFAPEPGKQEATKVGAIIRVKKDELNKFDYSEFPEQGWTTKNVPPKYLEFSTDNGKTWESLVKKAEKVNKEITNPLNFKTAEDYVKAQGTPVYHGTPEMFDNFSLEQVGKSTDSGMFGKGIYFTNDLKEATTYSKRGDKVGEVKEVVINLKKPYIINTKSDIPKIDVPMDTIEQMKVADKEYSRLFTEKLQQQGYDGVIDNLTPGKKQYVVFSPEQIKTKSQLISEWNKANKSVNNLPFTKLPKRDIMKVKKLSEKAFELTKKNDGVTISLKGDIPTTGYVYAPKKTTEKIIPEVEFKSSHIEDYIREHYDELLEEGNHFGNWKDGDKFVMDVSRVEKDLKKASTGAKAADQDGIFNLDNFETISRKDYEKFIDNAKSKNTQLPRKKTVKGGTNKGLSKKGKTTTKTKGDNGKLKLPAKPRIKYQPIEKPVDLRKKIKVERTIAEQSTPKRIQKDAIEKGLIDAYKDIPEYDKVNLKEQAAGVAKLIENDYELAKRIALGRELPKDNLLPESVLIGVKNQALKDGDTDLLIQLATDENGVAKGTTLLGQRIKALDEGLEDDAFRNIRRVVENRKKNATNKSTKTAKEVRAKANRIIAEAKPNKYDWSNLVKEITCKV